MVGRVRQEGLRSSGEGHSLPLPGHKFSDVSVRSSLRLQVLLGEEDIWEGAALMALPARAAAVPSAAPDPAQSGQGISRKPGAGCGYVA